MNHDILFRERQRFTQWWLWLLLMGVDLLFLYGIYAQVICGKAFGTNPASDTALICITLLVILVSVFVLSFRLDTEIGNIGITVKFFPLHFSPRCFTWDKIERSYVRQYNPIGEYGGWGYRFGFLGNGKAYNVSGNKGIQLFLKGGKRLLIGTKKPEEAKEALRKLGHLSE